LVLIEEQVEEKIEEFSTEKLILTARIKNFGNMIKGTENDIESAVGTTRDQYKEQLQILERRKAEMEEELSSYPDLQKVKSTVKEMIKAILQMREFEVGKNVSLAKSTYEQKFRGDRSAFIQNVKNTLELDRISKEIKRWKSKPDTIVMGSSGSRGSRTIPAQRPNHEKTIARA
jgi:hypothetical protein